MNARTLPLAAAISLSASALFLSASALAQDVYATDFTTLDGWTVESGCAPGYEWAADATPATGPCAQTPFHSAPHSLNFNDGVDIGGPGAHGGAHRTCGTATSPPIDLNLAGASATLTFWVALDMEPACEWDELRVVVRPAGGGAAFYDECLNPLLGADQCTWREFEIPLDVQWGVVEVRFAFDTLDTWFNDGAGAFIDDLRVGGPFVGDWSTHCVGAPSVVTGTNAALVPEGSFSLAENELRLVGDDFPPHTFAAAFYGAQPDVLLAGNGVRCIAAAQSFRLPIAPTRAQGRPLWNLDLAAPPDPTGTVLAGSTWYYQTIFRDGPSFNFSDAVRVTFRE